MPSLQSYFFKFAMRLIGRKNWGAHPKQIEKYRLDNSPEPPSKVYSQVKVSRSEICDRPVFKLEPHGKTSGKYIFFLHGGAYFSSFHAFHWQFLANVIRASGATIWAVDYPLTPEHQYSEVIEKTLGIYKSLSADIAPSKINIMGDSAGAGLSLAIVQRLRDEKLPQPQNVVLLSPWLDITMSNPGIPELDSLDPMLNIEGLVGAGKHYAGGAERDQPLLSPINMNFDGLNEISLFIGTHDIFFADSRKFKTSAEACSIKINYFEYPKMFHDWMIFPIPEAKKAVNQITDIINK